MPTGKWKCVKITRANGQVLTTVPITLGGTSNVTAVAAKDALTVASTDIASASTTNLATATGEAVTITGSVTITAFGTLTAGNKRVLTFSGAPLLTHNGTSLILPTGANVQAAAGDVAIMLSLGSGNWRCASYQLADGTFLKTTLQIARGGTSNTTAVAANDALHPASTNIAAATTTNLDSATGGKVTITGSTTITGFTLATAGTVRRLTFQDAPKITYNATSLKLPGAADIQAAAGDTCEVVSLGSSNVEVRNYVRAAVAPLLANVFTCNVRLTGTTSVPVTTADVTSMLTVYATPYLGNQMALYNGVEWKSYAFSEISIPLASSQTGTTHSGTKIIDGLTDTSKLCRGLAVTGTNVGAAAVISSIDSATQVTVSVNSTGNGTNTITFNPNASGDVYDIFAILSSGSTVLRLNKWTSSTARADAISVASTGIHTNTSVINSGDSNSIPAGQGTYLGSAAGFEADSKANRCLFNRFNRRPRYMAALPTDNTQDYSTASWGLAGFDESLFRFLIGLEEEPVQANRTAIVFSSAVTQRLVRAGIGLDTSSANSATMYDQDLCSSTKRALMKASYVGFPGIGIHYLQAIEYGGGADTQTWLGDNTGACQTGITGTVWA